MKTLLIILTLLLSTGCSHIQAQPKQQFTPSERIANCIEDTMDTIVVPDNITNTMQKVMYKAKRAKEMCNENL